MGEFSLTGFATHLAALTAKIVVAEYEALEHAARIVEHEAKDAIGTYQSESGPFVAWAELADSTKADRVAKGFAEDEPELRTGDLRDSIHHTVRMAVLGEAEAHIGSDSDIMVYQELGTAKMPPRSILGGAAARKEAKVVEVLGGEVVAVLMGQGVHRGALPIN